METSLWLCDCDTIIKKNSARTRVNLKEVQRQKDLKKNKARKTVCSGLYTEQKFPFL